MFGLNDSLISHQINVWGDWFRWCFNHPPIVLEWYDHPSCLFHSASTLMLRYVLPNSNQSLQLQENLVCISFNRYANSEFDATNSANQKLIHLPLLWTPGVRSMRFLKRADALIQSQTALQSQKARFWIDWIEIDFQISNERNDSFIN